MRAILLSLALVAATAPARSEKIPGQDDAAPAASGDLAGHFLCPNCDSVNPHEASYCMACGAALGPREEKPWPRTPVTLAPELYVRYASFTFGIVTTYDAGRWGNELALTALYDFRHLDGAALGDNIYFYFSERRLKPYISAEPYVNYVDGGDPVGRLAVGGGVRYGYGRYGSYARAGVSAGAYVADGEFYPQAFVSARILHLFTPHIGIGGGLGGSLFWSSISFGPAFAF